MVSWSLESIISSVFPGVSPNAVKLYIEKGDDGDFERCWEGGRTLLGEFLTFYDLPTRSFWSDAKLRGMVFFFGSYLLNLHLTVLDYRNLRLFIEKFKNLNIPIMTALTLNRVLGRVQ